MTRAAVALSFVAVTGLLVALAYGADRPASVTLTYPDGSTSVYVPDPGAMPPASRPPPATLPTEVPQSVALPPLARKVAPAAGDRGDGIVNRGLRAVAWTITDTHVEGFEQNIAVENFPGPITLANVTSVNAWRAKSADVYRGQGLYLDKCGPVTIAGSFFGGNGWQPGKPENNRTGFRHGIYQNVGAGPLAADDSLFVDNPGAGVQLRAGGTLRRSVFVGNGIGVLAVRGPVVLEDCTWVGGHPYANTDADGKVKSWSGNSAVYAYTDVTLRNCTIVGTPGQGDRIGTTPTYVNGALATDRNHRDNPGKAGRITCENVKVVGWPTRTVPGTADVVGAVTQGGSPVAYDPTPVLELVKANRITKAAASARIRADVAALAANP